MIIAHGIMRKRRMDVPLSADIPETPLGSFERPILVASLRQSINMTLLRVALCLVAFAPAAFAQLGTRQPITDSSVVQIMAHVGTQAGALWLRDVLRQADADYPQAKLDEIGDSLVARAIDARAVAPNSEGEKRAFDALGALTLAGSSAPLRGRPYTGALDRLIMVHRQAASPAIRTRALGGMLAVSSSETRAVDYLSAVAVSRDPAAYDAIEFLIIDANGGSWAGARPSDSQQQRSIAALKALASARRVRAIKAAALLEIWISNNRN